MLLSTQASYKKKAAAAATATMPLATFWAAAPV